MVYLHFPSNLTEEELMLQAKYQKLKKKKKALQALKAPKQEPEKPVLPKRPTEARDAREIARKLIKSGAIQAIKTPPTQPQNATFKRPRAGTMPFKKIHILYYSKLHQILTQKIKSFFAFLFTIIHC